MGQGSSTQAASKEVRYKVMLMGDSGVGKTSFIRSLQHRTFNEQEIATNAIDSYTLPLTLEHDGPETKMLFLDVWDWYGAERLVERQMQNGFGRNLLQHANIVVLFCDIQRPETINRLPLWMLLAKSYSPPDTLYVIVATHDDITNPNREEGIQALNRLPWRVHISRECVYLTNNKDRKRNIKVLAGIMGQVEKRWWSTDNGIKDAKQLGYPWGERRHQFWTFPGLRAVPTTRFTAASLSDNEIDQPHFSGDERKEEESH